MNCNFCHEEKPESEFYASNRSKCKICIRERVKANRAANIDRYREYDRGRGNRQSPGYVKEYRDSHPAKFKAHNILNNAVRDGHISRKPCEVCGSEFSHAHHDDYFKPLLVRWLCAAHHKQWHEENGEAANGSASIEQFNVAVYGLRQA